MTVGMLASNGTTDAGMLVYCKSSATNTVGDGVGVAANRRCACAIGAAGGGPAKVCSTSSVPAGTDPPDSNAIEPPYPPADGSGIGVPTTTASVMMRLDAIGVSVGVGLGIGVGVGVERTGGAVFDDPEQATKPTQMRPSTIVEAGSMRRMRAL
jgi:hypothetical protein